MQACGCLTPTPQMTTAQWPRVFTESFTVSITSITTCFHWKTYSDLRCPTRVQLVVSPMTWVDATLCHNVRITSERERPRYSWTNFSISCYSSGLSLWCRCARREKIIKTGIWRDSNGNLVPLSERMHWKNTLDSLCAMRLSSLKYIPVYTTMGCVLCCATVMCTSLTPIQKRHSSYKCIHLKIYMYHTANTEL